MSCLSRLDCRTTNYQTKTIWCAKVSGKCRRNGTLDIAVSTLIGDWTISREFGALIRQLATQPRLSYAAAHVCDALAHRKGLNYGTHSSPPICIVGESMKRERTKDRDTLRIISPYCAVLGLPHTRRCRTVCYHSSILSLPGREGSGKSRYSISISIGRRLSRARYQSYH